MTKISIQITVTRDGINPVTFSQTCESKNNDGAAIWPATVTGLELAMSKMHRHFFPTPEEKESDEASAEESKRDHLEQDHA